MWRWRWYYSFPRVSRGSSKFVLRNLHGPYSSATIFIENIPEFMNGQIRLRGWVYRLRILGKTAFSF